MGNVIEKINKALTPLEYDNKINEIIDLLAEGGTGGLGLPTGTIIPVNSNINYIPDGLVPCDGQEYSASQFKTLWTDYLKGEGSLDLTTINKFRAVDYNGNYQLNGYTITPILSSRDTAGYCPCHNHIEDEDYREVVLCLTYSDVTACQSIISGHNGATALYIENGNICTHSIKTEAATTWTVTTKKAVSANIPFYIRAVCADSTNTAHNYTCVSTFYYSADGKVWESLTDDETLMATHKFYYPLQSWFSNEIRNGETYTTTTATIDGYKSYIIDKQGNKHRIVQNVSYIQNKLVTCSYIDYDKEVMETGQCAKFGIDLENEMFKVPTLHNKLITGTEDISTIKYDLTCTNSQRFRYPDVDSLGKINSLSGGTMESDNTVGFSPYSTSSITSEYFGIAAFHGTNRKTIEGATTPAISGSWVKMNIDPNDTWIADLSETRPAVEIRYFVVLSNGQVNKSMMDWEAWATGLQAKAGCDLANINQTARDRIIKALTPDYTAGIDVPFPVAATPFVAPCDGIYIVEPYKNNAQSYMFINETTTFYYYDRSDSILQIPFHAHLLKGDVVYWNNTLSVNFSKFYPYRGAA